MIVLNRIIDAVHGNHEKAPGVFSKEPFHGNGRDNQSRLPDFQ